jgi:L-rhamnose mutarotase
MKRTAQVGLVAAVVAAIAISFGFAPAVPKKTLRIGKVIGIRPEKIAEYKRLHSGDNCVVRDLLSKYHLHNFSIFLREIDEKWYEFAYCEYDGDDLNDDMARLSAEPRNQKWMGTCDAMQISLKNETSWAIMDEVFYNP